MNERQDIPVIGLVGGIGSGKSTVAAELAQLGCAVIDGDAIGHELLAAGDVKTILRGQWGPAIFKPDGNIDRTALGEIVFGDAAALDRLNATLHPRIEREIGRRIDLLRRDASVPAIVLDAAIMLEARWDRICTHLVFVDAPDEERFARVHASRGWDRAAWERREKSQISLDKKRGQCLYTVDNSSKASCLREQVRRLFFLMTTAADRT